MSVLLPTDDLALRASTATDAHGWAALQDSPAVWSGRGSLQLAAGGTNVAAADQGGAGPFAPASVPAGTVYLPPESNAADGMVLSVRGKHWTLANTRLVVDPTGSGGLDCYVAEVTTAEWAT